MSAAQPSSKVLVLRCISHNTIDLNQKPVPFDPVELRGAPTNQQMRGQRHHALLQSARQDRRRIRIRRPAPARRYPLPSTNGLIQPC